MTNDCPFAPPAPSSIAARLRHRGGHLLIPPLRAWIRYGPRSRWTQALWDAIVAPRLAWHRHRFVARTRFGARLAGDTVDILQQYVYYFGQWEPEITRRIERTLRPGDVFVDVGANVGYFSLLASRLVGERGAVVAIEPSPTLCAELARNVARNRARNVRIVDVAVSDRDERLEIFRGPASHTGLTTTVAGAGLELEARVDAKPLSALLTQAELSRIRLVKVDVEGAEAAVAAGMEPLFRNGRDDLELLVEIHPELLAGAGRRPEDVIELLEGGGFHAYLLENDYSPAALFARGRDARPERAPERIDFECNLLFTRSRPE